MRKILVKKIHCILPKNNSILNVANKNKQNGRCRSGRPVLTDKQVCDWRNDNAHK